MPRGIRRALALAVLLPACRAAAPPPAPRPPAPRPPAPRLEGLFERCGGRWGIYFRDLETGETVERNSTAVFHAASTMKLLVLIKVFRDLEDGRYRPDTPVAVVDTFPSAVRGGFRTEPEAAEVRDAIGKTLSVEELVGWMIARSDNLATNLLIRQAGGPQAISEHARRYGLRNTTVARYIEDQAAFEAGLSSRAEPRELGQFLEKLWRGEVVSPAASAGMLGVLARAGPEWLGLRLPAGTTVAHKIGAIDGVRHDVGIITVAPGRAFVLCVMADGLADEKAAEEAIAEVGRHFFDGKSARAAER